MPDGCTAPALSARQLHLRHDLIVTDCSVQSGVIMADARSEPVRPGARSGSLQITGSTLGDATQVDERPDLLVLDLSGTTIGDRLAVRHSRLVGGHTVESADIDRMLTLVGTSIRHAHTALDADGVAVTGDVFLSTNFAATGEVRLPGGRIGGRLIWTGGDFTNPDAIVLAADGAQIGGGVFLRTDLTATGQVRLPGASIGGQLTCTGGTYTNPQAPRSTQSASAWTGLFWEKLARPPQGVVDLRHARIAVLIDDRPNWPAAGQLRLDGFTYTALPARALRDPATRTYPRAELLPGR